MKYRIDHDLHIHSNLSACRPVPEQTPERILHYAQERGLHTICLSNHMWDECMGEASPVYQKQGLEHVLSARPLPQAEGIRFILGCEAELRHDMTLGLAKEHYDLFDFILTPTTHFAYKMVLPDRDTADVHDRAERWVQRFSSVLDMDLPFHKVGIPHLTCPGIETRGKDRYLSVLQAIPDAVMGDLLSRAAKLGVGIELNGESMFYDGNLLLDEKRTADIILRPFRIAKACGCKFYCGSDAHVPEEFDESFGALEKAIDLLELAEEDKFILQ